MRSIRIQLRINHTYSHLSKGRLFRTSAQSWNSQNSQPVIKLENVTIYPYGKVKEAVFQDITWTVKPGEAWVIISNSNATRGEIFQALLGKRRIQPIPSSGVFPFLHEHSTSAGDRLEGVVHVSFGKRNVIAGGEFTDYTARYGAMRDQDGKTLLENLLESVSRDPPPPPPTEFTKNESLSERKDRTLEEHRQEIVRVAERLNLLPQLEIPMIALSNGQQRRARILRQLIKHPRILLLEDPFAGLDVIQRPILSSLLGQLNSQQDPFVLMELRPQDPIPEWITNVVVVEGQTLRLMSKDSYTAQSQNLSLEGSPHAVKTNIPTAPQEKEIVRLQDVRVAYGEREVLRNITWSVHSGERWWLRGPNGSGKTTLLSMLTGEHPQSYTQKHFDLFGTPRPQIPTVSLERQISIFTPEIYSAFPRRFGPGALTVADAIGTGFSGTYSYRRLTEEQNKKRAKLISQVAPGETEEQKLKWSKQLFAELPPPEQALALLMRTLVSQSPLIILDEVFGGMDDRMIRRASDHLRENLSPDQAVIFVSHWQHEAEAIWPDVKTYMIENGVGRIP